MHLFDFVVALWDRVSMLFSDLLEVENPRKYYNQLKWINISHNYCICALHAPKILGYSGSQKGSRRPLGGSPRWQSTAASELQVSLWLRGSGPRFLFLFKVVSLLSSTTLFSGQTYPARLFLRSVFVLNFYLFWCKCTTVSFGPWLFCKE